MVPLEVTHSNLVTPEILHQISQIETWEGQDLALKGPLPLETSDHPHVEYPELFQRIADISG